MRYNIFFNVAMIVENNFFSIILFENCEFFKVFFFKSKVGIKSTKNSNTTSFISKCSYQIVYTKMFIANWTPNRFVVKQPLARNITSLIGLKTMIFQPKIGIFE